MKNTGHCCCCNQTEVTFANAELLRTANSPEISTFWAKQSWYLGDCADGSIALPFPQSCSSAPTSPLRCPDGYYCSGLALCCRIPRVTSKLCVTSLRVVPKVQPFQISIQCRAPTERLVSYHHPCAAQAYSYVRPATFAIPRTASAAETRLCLVSTPSLFGVRRKEQNHVIEFLQAFVRMEAVRLQIPFSVMQTYCVHQIFSAPEWTSVAQSHKIVSDLFQNSTKFNAIWALFRKLSW